MKLTKAQKELMEQLPDGGQVAISHRYSHSWGYVCGKLNEDGGRDVVGDNAHILTIRALERKGLLLKTFDGEKTAGWVQEWERCEPDYNNMSENERQYRDTGTYDPSDPAIEYDSLGFPRWRVSSEPWEV